MEELALHILDLAQNSIAAGASEISITIVEKRVDNRLTITIADNGRGMEPEMLRGATDPFFTTRTTRRIGLGLSLLEAAAELCDGNLVISSTVGKGTKVCVEFAHDHIDRAPLGNMADTLTTLLAVNANIEIIYHHEVDGKIFVLDSRELRQICEDTWQHPKVVQWLREYIVEQERLLGGER